MGVGRGIRCSLVAGATMFMVGALFRLAVPLIAPTIPPQFENTALFRPWAEWTSTYMVLHPFGFGVVFAAVYLVLRARHGVAGGWRGGFAYGAVVFAVGSFPVYLLALASFQVSAEVIASWIAQSWCQYTAAGAAIGLVAGQAGPWRSNDSRP
jgi:hypothetical protein